MSASRSTPSKKNVSRPERWGSVVAGGALAYLGLKRGWLGTLLLGGAGAALAYRGASGHCAVYEQLDMNTASGAAGDSGAVEAKESATVQASPQEVYELWRDVERFPAFMHHLQAVEEMSETRSRWTARPPKGAATVSWEAEITADEPGKRIAWQSLPGSTVENSGEVRFREAPKGAATEVHVHIRYQPPGGAAGRGAARLFNPSFEQLVKNDARRFKHVMEAGEVPTIEGQPTGS